MKNSKTKSITYRVDILLKDFYCQFSQHYYVVYDIASVLQLKKKKEG